MKLDVFMKKIEFLILFFCLVFFNISKADVQNADIFLKAIVDHSGECIQNINSDKVYLNPEAIHLHRSQFFLIFDDESYIVLPTLYEDNGGLFVQVKAVLYWECTQCGRAYSSRPPARCGGRFNGKKCDNTQFRAVIVGRD